MPAIMTPAVRSLHPLTRILTPLVRQMGPFSAQIDQAINLLINATFSRGGAAAWVRGFDVTTGLKLVQTAVDGPAVEGLRLARTMADGALYGQDNTLAVPALGTGWSQNPDGTFTAVDAPSGSTVNIGTILTDEIWEYDFDVLEITSGGFKANYGVVVGYGVENVVEEVKDLTSANRLRAVGTTNGTVRINSLRKVVPTWVNDDGTGATLHPTNAAGHYLKMNAWPGAAQAVSAGDYCVGKVGNHFYYFQADGAGTTAGSEPVWAASGTITDNDFGWVFKGRYSNLGSGVVPYLLHEPAATNTVTNSESITDPIAWEKPAGTSWVPDDLTTTGNKRGFADKFTVNSGVAGYLGVKNQGGVTLGDVLWSRVKHIDTPYVWLSCAFALNMEVEFDILNGKVGTVLGATNYGIIPHPDGSYTIWVQSIVTNIAYKQVLSPKSAHTSRASDVSPAACSIHHIASQGETGTRPSSYIPTTTAPVTRPATLQTVPNPLPANDFQVRGRFIDTENVASNVILYTLGANRFALFTNGANLSLDKYVDNAWAGSSAVWGVNKGQLHSFGMSISSTAGATVALDGIADATPILDFSDLSGDGDLSFAFSLEGGIVEVEYYTGTDPDWFKDTTWSDA